MVTTASPLETLAAFVIVFAAGVVSTAALGGYIAKLRRAADASATPKSA